MFLSILLAAALMVAAPDSSSARASENVIAADQGKVGEKQPDKGKTEAPETKPVVTRHKIVIRGKEISYTATAGQLPIMNDAGENEAHIFFIAYTVNNSTPGSRRPLLFLFNGGPGASSVWLHLGAAGPRRVQMLADGRMPPPPYLLVDNEFTWMDKADLVFIDPVGTGYSRA
ncbi:MAG TPA: hypothetical protein VEJ88_08220, partial [Dissulfurispiraceae bacterium]|nr:hypothetical protein [Dissulfurispiraceae bacterium]